MSTNRDTPTPRARVVRRAQANPDSDSSSSSDSTDFSRPPDVLCRQKVFGPLLVILYGSQTGTAEDVAERIAREAFCWGIKVYIGTMDSVAFWKRCQFIGDGIVFCFVCSTTGQGDVPDNMKRTWLHMLKKQPNLSFYGNKFGVLGLGDSSYENYNVVAKKLFKRLQQLNAVPLPGIELGLADDQHECGAEFVIDPWIEKFFKEAVKILLEPEARFRGPTEAKFVISPSVLHEPRTVAESLKHPIKLCELISQHRVTTEDHFQDVRLISISLKNSGLSYEPGDVLMVQPCNLDEHVDRLFNLVPTLGPMRNRPYQLITIMPWAKFPHHLATLYPQPWTLHFIIKHFLDLGGRPTRRLFHFLGNNSDDPTEREGLQNLASVEGQGAMYNYCLRPKRTILEVLEDFPLTCSKLIPYFLIDLIGIIKPRAFSIAGNSSADSVNLLVAVVNYKTSLREPRIGLCSTWLSRLTSGHKIPIWVEKGTLAFPPPNSESPIIMVGPGTGVAPFRCLIQRRAGNNKMILFFGCRFESKDFYFHEEFDSYKESSTLEFFTAFSRDNPDAGKTYVQHRIEEQARYIGDLIVNQGGCVFIAGNAKDMPAAVRAAIEKAVAEAGVRDPVAFVKKMERDGKYQTEVW